MLLDFASPKFFDVMPAKALWGTSRSLMKSTKQVDEFSDVLGQLADVVKRVGIEVQLAGPKASAAPQGDPQPVSGDIVLQLYFAQLAHADRVALDLRRASFFGQTRPATWKPRVLWHRWDPDFLDAIRQLYAGYYRDDDARFEGAAARLGLAEATDLLQAHFGVGDQRAVRFDLDHFKQSFHDVFVRCLEAGNRLPSDFVVLGVYLGTLYEHLSTPDEAFDVRSAFESVWPTDA